MFKVGNSWTEELIKMINDSYICVLNEGLLCLS